MEINTNNFLMISRRKFDTIFWWVLFILACALLVGINANLDAQGIDDLGIPEVYILNSGGNQYFIERDTGDTLAILIPMILLEDLPQIETFKERKQ